MKKEAFMLQSFFYVKVPKARSRTNRHAVAVAREMKHEFLCNDLA